MNHFTSLSVRSCLGLAAALLLMFPAQGHAQQAKQTTRPLWPDMPPGAEHRGEGDVPELLITQVDSKEPTAAVVILPGGGYGGHAMDHEGHQFAEWFESLGVTSAICTYRLRGKGNAGKGYGHPYPMLDAQRAIQTLRAEAERWNLDPNRIGVIGFSAGGHLASTVSTHFAEPDSGSADPIAHVSSRPNFSILCYPVIAFGKPYTHKGSQRNLIGADPDPELLVSLSNERQVSEQTPPTFLFHTAADKVVPVQNSLDYFIACQQNNVAAEIHVFPDGHHGVGLARNIAGASQWPKLCEQWLRREGVVRIRR
ncbi:MAG: alpha/beta hydrolase [Pirellulales bacterium]|nr:alpha/beta hydrolase [Pirellulales bacterium]